MNDPSGRGAAGAAGPSDAPSFEHVASIGSTNAELMRRPFAARPAAPVVLLADVQDAGRGRNGRRWVSDPASSLTFSVAIERVAGGAGLLGLPLAVGVAVAEVLAAHGARPRLKWPNDLWCDTCGPPAGEAKAGGILVEARQLGERQRIVAGCGLNLVSSASLEAAGLGQPVTGLFAPGERPDRIGLARELGAAVAAAVVDCADRGLGPYLARWRSLDLLAGRAIDVLGPDGLRRPGLADGIDDDGTLRVVFDDGSSERLVAGEVSIRPR